MTTPLLSTLRAALRTLTPGQGRIARRNARRRVFTALTALRNEVDANFPAIVKERKPGTRKPNREPWQVRRDLIRDGWVLVNHAGADLLAVAAEMKLPVQRTKAGMWSAATSTTGGGFTSATWVPGWVAHYYPNRTLLAQAHRNTRMIVAAKAAIKLGGLADHIKRGTISCPSR